MMPFGQEQFDIYHSPGHPCSDYVEKFKQDRQRETNEYRRALSKLLETPREINARALPRYALGSSVSKRGSSWHEENSGVDCQTEREKANPIWMKFLVALIAVGLILFLLSQLNFGLSEPPQALSCSDGTPDSNCSVTLPFYCSNGSFVEKPGVCGCPDGFRIENGVCVQNYVCSDGTLAPNCSKEKPGQCVKGKIVDNASFCGCPYDYEQVNNSCQKIKRCADGTRWGVCSSQKPMYCDAGMLVTRASVCGCPAEFTVRETDDVCISKFLTDPKTINFFAVVLGKDYSFTFSVYRGLSDYLLGLDRDFVCDPVCPTSDQMTEMTIDDFLNEPHQESEINALVSLIESQESNLDDRARLAISLVQNIHYDGNRAATFSFDERYPYQVLYDNSGVCGEKSKLLALLLSKLGFGVAIIDYPSDQHEAVGIYCPSEYSLDGTGYCFIESNSPTIITDDQGDYVGVGKLDEYTIYPVSDGRELESVYEEYEDAKHFEEIMSMGYYLEDYYYYNWLDLVEKYGLQTS